MLQTDPEIQEYSQSLKCEIETWYFLLSNCSMGNEDDGYEADRDMFTKSSDMSDIFPATFDHTAETELGQDYVIHLVPSSTFRTGFIFVQHLRGF